MMYRDQVMGCWLGKAIGGTLGMPYEGVPGPLSLSFYDPVPSSMVPNDDLDLQVVWACLLAQQPNPEVSRQALARGWQKHIFFPWDEYAVCLRNLREGIAPPHSGSFDNWFITGMGAAIRSELWACLTPGQPKLAAAYAFEDACLDHDKEGLWAEVWLAAVQSAAFVTPSIEDCVAIGLDQLPANVEIRAVLEDTFHWWAQSGDWMRVRTQIIQRYGHENFTHVTPNLGFILLALLDGNGDFSRSICTAANCGLDTDCTAATTGALLGIMNPAGIDKKWLFPIGQDLQLSPQIEGIAAPPTLESFTDLVLDLQQRLAGRPPPTPAQIAAPDKTIPARIGFADRPWFEDGKPPCRLSGLAPPALTPFQCPGTHGTLGWTDFRGTMLFLEFTFVLTKETAARICFNTREKCRVYLDGHYLFGRDGGGMAPSAHRIPPHQSADLRVASGTHRLTAVIARPTAKQSIEWVVGIADREDHWGQWIPNVFMS